MQKIYHYYLDASCLIKLVLDEEKSTTMKNFFYSSGVFFTTSFCFYEALGALKSKSFNKKRPDKITYDAYLSASYELCEIIKDTNIQLEDTNFIDCFLDAKDLADKYKLDLSDAFQLLTLKSGMIAKLNIGDPILLSEDKALVIAAISEGLIAKTVHELIT